MKEIVYESNKVLADNLPTGNVAGYSICRSYSAHRVVVVALNNYPQQNNYGLMDNNLIVNYPEHANSFGDYLKIIQEKYPERYRLFWFESKKEMLEYWQDKDL